VADNRDSVRAEALRLTAAEGFGAACHFIEAFDAPVAVASAYKDFSQALYHQNKDVQHMIEAGLRGIELALDHAARAASDDAKTAAMLVEIAKMMAFNVGANTWPGWNDDGIDISPDQRETGMEAAMLSLRLVTELRLGPQQTGNAHWLVAAHHIAARRPEAALAALDTAAQAYATAGDSPSEIVVRGYRALARKLSPETRAAAQAEFDQALQCLGQDKSKAAAAYRHQIMVADRILCVDPE
jgi:hypothetical protein